MVGALSASTRVTVFCVGFATETAGLSSSVCEGGSAPCSNFIDAAPAIAGISTTSAVKACARIVFAAETDGAGNWVSVPAVGFAEASGTLMLGIFGSAAERSDCCRETGAATGEDGMGSFV